MGWGRVATTPGSNLCVVSALWKYYRSLQPKELDHLTSSIYIQGSPLGVTTQHMRRLHHYGAASLLSCHMLAALEWDAYCIQFNINAPYEAFTDQCVYRTEYFFPPQHGFLHDLMNGTIELIWLSSLYKIRDKIQCLNTPTQSLVQHHHQLKPDLNIEGCPLSGIAPILLYLPGVVDAIMLNKQAVAYDSV